MAFLLLSWVERSKGSVVYLGVGVTGGVSRVTGGRVRGGWNGQCTSHVLRIVQCRLRSPHGRDQDRHGGLRRRYSQRVGSRCRDNQSNPHTGPPPVWPVLLVPAFLQLGCRRVLSPACQHFLVANSNSSNSCSWSVCQSLTLSVTLCDRPGR